MNDKNTIKNEIKERNSILEVAQELIPNLKRSGGVWVGSIRNEATPALTIYPATESYYHFAGDTNPAGQNGGDVISLVQYVKGVDFKEALRFLAERAGIQLRPVSPEEAQAVEEAKQKSIAKDRALEKLTCIFESNQEKAIQYLEGRGIKSGIIKEYRIGWSNHTVAQLRKELQESDSEIVNSILSNPTFFDDSLIIPIVQHGVIVSLYSRSENRTPKHLYLTACPKGIFNYDMALKTADKRVYLAEAPIDALSAISNGISNILGFGGCKLSDEQKEILSRLSKREVEIVTCFDNDSDASDGINRGFEATKSLLDSLTNTKMKVLPPGDLNEFFLVKTKEDFEILPEKNYFELLLEEIPTKTSPANLPVVLNPLYKALTQNGDPAFSQLFLSHNVKEHFGITARDVEALQKSFKKVSEKILLEKAEEEARQKRSGAVEEKRLTSEEKEAASKILCSPTLLYDMLRIIKKLGVVGEEKNVQIVYCVLTSRLLQHPLSIVVKGASSAGKSHTSRTVLFLMPQSAYIDLTDATPQSFYYVPDDYFKHKIIIIFERHGSEKADYPIRSLQSENKLKIQVTIQNPHTGKFETDIIEKSGPTGFITTTTAATIHAENETRNISIFPDETPEQTLRIYEATEAHYLGLAKPNESELEPWKNAQLILEQLPVYIPYVSSLKKYFPNGIIRTRRDYGHFLAFIETLTFLHQKQREKVDVNGKLHIRASLADYYIASAILGESLSKSVYELPPKTISLIEAAREIIQEKESNNPGPSDESHPQLFTITELAKKVNWGRDAVADWTKPATEKGYFTLVNEHRGSKGAEYAVEAKELPGDVFLPSVDQLLADNPDEPTGGVYNPLTGEQITIKNCTDVPMPKEVPTPIHKVEQKDEWNF